MKIVLNQSVKDHMIEHDMPNIVVSTATSHG
jgi:hypothetical protein